jgi:hypothetical protein
MWTPASHHALSVLICAGALWLGLVAALSAQAPADLDAYDLALKEAVEAHREQRWADAHELFGRAHALYPNARTLRGLGVSAFEAGEHALALRDLEAALLHPERPFPPDLRASVQALVAHLREQVGVYVFRLDPVGAELRIDDAAPIVSPMGEVLLEPGRHRATLSRAGYVTQMLELDAHGGDRSELRVALLPESIVLPQVSAERPTVELPRPLPALGPRVDGGWTWQRTSALVTGSVGLASFVTAGALLGVANGRVRDIDDTCTRRDSGGCSPGEPEIMEKEHDIPRLENAMTAANVVGSALVATSAVLWVLDWRARKAGKRTQHSALGLRVSF